MRAAALGVLLVLAGCRHEAATVAPVEAGSTSSEPTKPAASEPARKVEPTAWSCDADADCVLWRDCCAYHAYRQGMTPPQPSCAPAAVCTGEALPVPAGTACVQSVCVLVYAPTNVKPPPELACERDADCTVTNRCCGPRVSNRSHPPPPENCAEVNCPMVKRVPPVRVVCRANHCVGLGPPR